MGSGACDLNQELPTKRWRLDEAVWTQTVLTWAQFAQGNNVEMFAPGVEMSLILDEEAVGPWFRMILPQIRAVYSGQIVTAEHPYIGRWEILDQYRAFEGYNGIGMTIFPGKRDDGENASEALRAMPKTCEIVHVSSTILRINMISTADSWLPWAWTSGRAMSPLQQPEQRATAWGWTSLRNTS